MSSHNALNIENNENPELLDLKTHAKYFVRFLNLLPARLSSHDSTRGTIAFFAVCGLDILNSLSLLSEQMRHSIIEWTYGGLVVPRENEPMCGGFQGSRSVIIDSKDEELLRNARKFQWGHLAITYTSIGVLVTLGDDLSRLDRKSIVDGVAAVQQPDGSFSACINGSENDMRFVYCAAAICNMLDYWGDVDKEKMFQFITNSLRYDYGFSQHLEGEAHGGTTFCALAALELSDQLHRLDSNLIERIKRWLLFRQVDGFQGRPNKPVDTCYSFWIGAALRIVNGFDLIDYAENRKYIMETQDNFGGFSKWPLSTTDPFHTYFGLCGLSFMREPNLLEIKPSLNITLPAYQRLLQLHANWRLENVNLDLKTSLANNADKLNNGNINDRSETDSTTDNTSITSPLIKAQ